jgi:uncharacterized repeat protein (TIGR02543 family)
VDGTIAAYTVTTPAHGSMTQTDSLIAYTPAKDFAGIDSFNFTATDNLGGVSAPATVRVQVVATTFALTINATNGSVTKSPDAALYDSTTVVQLTAVPSVGYTFSGWSGALTGATNPASIAMNAAKTVTATFSVKLCSLTVTATTGGTISAPTGPVVLAAYNSQTTITAVALTGYSFVKWIRSAPDVTIADSLQATTTVAITAKASVSATFILNAPAVPVALLPAIGLSTASDSMLFVWNKAAPLIDKYGIRIATDSAMTSIVRIDSAIADTFVTQRQLPRGQTYYWQVRAHNTRGWGNYGEKRKFTVIVPTAVLPRSFSVAFSLKSSRKNVVFALPEAAEVTMQVFDMQGKIVKAINPGILPAGYHTINLDFSSLAKGQHIMVFKAGKECRKTKVINISDFK